MEKKNQLSLNNWRTKVSEENPHLLKKAREELNEDPETRDQYIQTLRELVLGEENLKSPTDDAFLVKFLRVRKFNIEQAFELLKNCYAARNKFSFFFTNYRPSALLVMLNTGACFIPHYKDQHGRTIVVIQTRHWDPAENSVYEFEFLMHMVVELAISEEEVQIYGIVVIVDLKHFSFTQGSHITPNAATCGAALFQNCLPARFRSFHFIFESAIFDLVYMLIKPFLNEKLRSRMNFHGSNLASLHEHIHPEFLPEEYGGLRPPCDVDVELQSKALLAYEEEILNHVKNYGYGVD